MIWNTAPLPIPKHTIPAMSRNIIQRASLNRSAPIIAPADAIRREVVVRDRHGVSLDAVTERDPAYTSATSWTGLQTGTISLILCDISWQYMKCSCWDLRGMNGSCDCL
jgi:hypothetical protein